MSTMHVTMRSGSVQLAHGPRLRYVEHGDPAGAPIVFLHGWPDSWFSWSRVLPLLPPGLRALALDQRGFGDSDRPQAGYAVEDFARDVAAFLDALRIDHATIVGHSFGSFVARQVAIAHAPRVSRLVLIGTGAASLNDITREVQRSVRDLPEAVPVEFAREFQASTIFRPIAPEFFDALMAESLKMPGRLWRGIFDRLLELDDAESLCRIAAPTLLVWGDRDALFSRLDQDRVVASIPGARLTVYAETGHCPNWELPGEVANDLGRFMQTDEAGRTRR
jgi:non-heme chloroperoxidase